MNLEKEESCYYKLNGVERIIGLCIVPFIHGSPSPRHPLIHNPLVVPDAGHVADAVQPITVGISCPRHIDQSVNRKYFGIYLEHACLDQYHISYHNYLELEQTEQLLPGDVV